MKTGLNIILILGFIALFACEEGDENIVNTDNLTGYWVNRQVSDTTITFQRSAGLKDNDYGIAFKDDGTFTERKNAGWCGTPPITYSDFEGTWTKNDSIVNITVGYWGGSVDYQWKVIRLDNKELIIKLLMEEYHYNNLLQ